MRKQVYYIGENSTDHLKRILKGKSAKNILLVTGKKSYETSGAKSKIEPILENYLYFHFSDFSKNPCYEDIERSLNLFNSLDYDTIIAVGGGSVIDMAKLINISSAYNIEIAINEGIKDKIQLKPLIAIPTTAGSGSEATHFSVVYKNKVKYSIAYPNLQPEMTIIDPVFTYNSPSYLSACCAWDALSQAIESYWNTYSTDESLLYAEKAIWLIWSNILEAVLKNNKSARNALAEGSYWAGRAINITKTTAAHALSYPLTIYYGYPHGHAVAVFLPEVLKFNMAVALERNDNMSQKMFNLCSLFGCNNATQLYFNLKHVIKKLSLTLAEKEKIELRLILENVNPERLNNNPIKLNLKDIEQIVKQIY